MTDDELQQLYPEHAKLAGVTAKSQAVGAFLDWASQQGYCLAKYADAAPDADPEDFGRYVPTSRSIQEWLALFFGIDRARLSREKEAMLVAVRRAQGLDAAGRPL